MTHDRSENDAGQRHPEDVLNSARLRDGAAQRRSDAPAKDLSGGENQADGGGNQPRGRGLSRDRSGDQRDVAQRKERNQNAKQRTVAARRVKECYAWRAPGKLGSRAMIIIRFPNKKARFKGLGFLAKRFSGKYNPVRSRRSAARF